MSAIGVLSFDLCRSSVSKITSMILVADNEAIPET